MSTQSSPKNPEPSTAEATAEHKSWPVVAVGASAGGLDAFSDLLSHLPANTGLSFVLIQHLDPHHESMLTELLQQRTPMKVQQAVNGVNPEPDNVYVIPPNTSMQIRRQTLQIQSRTEGAAQMPIDTFFRSLAEDLGAMSIGVVLSGSASDGTLGLKAIKGEGGITFAQDPASAAFDGMPRSAIAAGCVDFVLSPSRIAQELVRISRHPYISDHGVAHVSEDVERDFAEIFSILRSAKGVDFSLYKHGTIRRRIYRRMAVHKIEKPSDYVRFLRDRRSEAEALFQDLLISVTSFFREAPTFKALRDRVYPVTVNNRGVEDPVRVWIPGCSTGEEAYSVAISLLEFSTEAGLNTSMQIFGTDLSDAALERARAGVYPESIAADISADRLRRFFTRINGNYQINRSIRDMCIFARQDLTKDPPFSHLDLLVCRNVLIYLGPLLQKKIMKVFHYALKPSGFLVLGISETVGGASDLFAPMDRSLKIYARKQAAGAASLEFDSYEEGPLRAHAHRPAAENPAEVQKKMDQILLSRHAPAAVVVNHDLRIIHFRGQTGKFLEHAAGAANLNLLRMTNDGIGLEVRNLIAELEKKKSPLEAKLVSVRVEGNIEDVLVSVSPMDGLPGEPQFLVVFEEQHFRAEGKPGPRGSKKKTAVQGRVAELEEELAITRRYLQTVIEDQEAITEELKSANEEIQSSNEELQSTNEELLTAKEELQSTNEELTTVNEEMQNRNDELVRSNNDLLNLLSSANIPIVMLGSDLKIRRFTPQTERLLNLVPTDVGRSLTDFKLKINVPDLDDLVRGVLDHLTPAEREVQDIEGRAYSMSIRPYRTSDNKIDGAVLALFDVTDRKELAEARYRRMFESARDGMIIADRQSAEILDVNPFACRLLGRARVDLVGMSVMALDIFHHAGITLQTIFALHEGDSLQREVHTIRRDGQWIDVEILGNVYQEGERRVIQFNLRDIALRRQLALANGAAEGDRQIRDLETAARIAASISRNFGNDLTTILILCDLVLRNHPDADFAGDIARIQDATKRAVALDRQLLAFGGRRAGKKEPLNINQILSNMDQLIGVVMGDRYTISAQTDPKLRAVEASPGQIEGIILNLLMHARRSVPDHGNISIETANVTIDNDFTEKHPAVKPGDYVSISVTDSLPQTSPEAASVPVPFGRQRSELSGLPAALDAIRELGAQVWAVSELGVGSTVRVFFQPAAIAEKEFQEPARAPQAGSETILIVDPDDNLRAAAVRGLESSGYRVLHTASAEEAGRIVAGKDGSIDLLLADVNLKSGRRPERIREMAAHGKIKVAYTSSEPDALLTRDGILDKPDPLLRKPYSTEQVAEFIRSVLDRIQE